MSDLQVKVGDRVALKGQTWLVVEGEISNRPGMEMVVCQLGGQFIGLGRVDFDERADGGDHAKVIR